jgi:drug/metabolite transporter (DMT)-like permease
MSLAVAVPLGIGAAVAFGAGTAGQHIAAHAEGRPAGVRGLPQLVREPRWLLSFGGQALGLVLQALALGAGPVVLIQPLLVLALPASLGFDWALGGPRPTRAQYIASLGMIVGLATFSALVGDGGAAAVPIWWVTAAMTGGALIAGAAVFRAVRQLSAPMRAAVYGVVSGAWSGIVGVLLDVVAQVWLDSGIAGFARPDGLAALVSLLVVGTCTIGSAQLAFQAGALAVSLPAMIAAEPVVAVILGATLLNENVPVSVGYALGYAACFALVLLASIRLAEPAFDAAQRA